MDINVTVNFGAASLQAINNLASALTGASPEKTPSKLTKVQDEPQAAPAPAPKTEAAKITVEALRALVSEKAKSPEAKAKVKEILGEFGAANVSTLSAEHYPDFFTRVKAI